MENVKRKSAIVFLVVLCAVLTVLQGPLLIHDFYRIWDSHYGALVIELSGFAIFYLIMFY